MTKLENNDTHELWSVAELDNEVMPLFLLDSGALSELIKKFESDSSSIITTKNGEIIKTHYNG